MPPFEYRVAHEVGEAVALWHDAQGASYLAGGTDLLAMARLGSARPSRLVDIKRIPALGEIRAHADGSLGIGAAATVAEVARHPLVRADFSPLATCCESLGSYPLRQRATVVGNLCNASPCADTAAALLALEATLRVVGKREVEREIPLAEFFRGPRKTALRKGELVVEVRVPARSAGARGFYGRIARRRGVDISTVAALVTEVPELKNERFRYRVTLLSVAPTPLRVHEAEKILNRVGLSDRSAARAAEAAQAACRPITDVRGTAKYRREMVGVLVARGVKALGGTPWQDPDRIEGR
ncbi:MAG: xanthine dehydrogenase family protein subunit M [Polyangia bacterium]|nr:xanthine dehydrogenase family protein subunit M [Polyangia bacterium]